jgi:nucleoside-diphosphate-sugar epimerase
MTERSAAVSAMKRVLVTGHRGYIGTVLVPMLLEHGYDVVGLDSDLFQRCTFYDGIVEIPEMRIDVRDVHPDNLAGFDAIIHLAGLSNDPLGDLNPHLTQEINYHASVRLATLAKRAGVQRFVFSSSCSLYGASGDDMASRKCSSSATYHFLRTTPSARRSSATRRRMEFRPAFGSILC